MDGAKSVKKEDNVITFAKAKLATWIFAPNEELTIRCWKETTQKLINMNLFRNNSDVHHKYSLCN